MICRGGGGLVGTANSSRLPSCMTPHSGNTPAAVNSRLAGPGVIPAAVFISTDITDPSAFRYNSSFPSPLHRGANPPPSETGMLSPTLTFPVELSERIEATNTSFRPVSVDTYASR